MQSNILVVFTNFINLPTLYVIPTNSPHAEVAKKSNKLIVNVDEMDEEPLTFICLLSDDAYFHSVDSDETTELTAYRADYPTGPFSQTVICGFAV